MGMGKPSTEVREFKLGPRPTVRDASAKLKLKVMQVKLPLNVGVRSVSTSIGLRCSGGGVGGEEGGGSTRSASIFFETFCGFIVVVFAGGGRYFRHNEFVPSTINPTQTSKVRWPSTSPPPTPPPSIRQNEMALNALRCIPTQSGEWRGNEFAHNTISPYPNQ